MPETALKLSPVSAFAMVGDASGEGDARGATRDEEAELYADAAACDAADAMGRLDVEC